MFALGRLDCNWNFGHVTDLFETLTSDHLHSFMFTLRLISLEVFLEFNLNLSFLYCGVT